MKTEKTYHDNGNLKEEYQVNDEGVRHGATKLYHKNGQLRAEVNYKNGIQIDGQVDSYDEDGNLVRSVVVNNGNLNGEFEEYYPNKKIKRKGVYKDDVIVEEILFDNYGNKTIKQLYNKVYSNSEFKQKLNEFKRKNNNTCSFEVVTLDFNKWGLYKKGYVLGSFHGHNFLKTSEIYVKWPICEYEEDEIYSFDEAEFLDYIGNIELNEIFLESENFEAGKVTSTIWNLRAPKDLINKSREINFFHNPWFLDYGIPDSDYTVYELESDTIVSDETDTILNSVVVKLRGENYNETLEWCFSKDKVSQSADRVLMNQLYKKIKDVYIDKLTELIVEVADSDGIDDLMNDVKDTGNLLIKEFEVHSESFIIWFDVLMDMFNDVWLATESIDDIYELIESENKGMSEIRFQLFTEMKVNFSTDKLFNGCLCQLIILFYSSLTENQKNEFEKDKIDEIEKFKSLIESFKK